MPATLKLGFLASRGGSSMRAILAAIEAGELAAEARLAISNNADAPALRHARERGVRALHVSARTEGSAEAADRRIAEALREAGVDWVVLSGYLRPVGPATLAAFPERVLNIHPALLPAYGGQGMYGRRVHEAVIAAGERVTGATVHLVDDEYDHGDILARRQIPVAPDDTAETIEARVMAMEPRLYIDALKAISKK